MKATILTIVVAVVALTGSSCKKVDWKFWEKDKRHQFYKVFGDCNVKRSYSPQSDGTTYTLFNKQYDSRGLVSSVSYASENLNGDTIVSYQLRYNPSDYSVDFIDLVSRVAGKVFFNKNGTIHQVRGVGNLESFDHLDFEYSEGRLSKIHWDDPNSQTSDYTQALSYDANGNLVKSVFLRVGETNEENSFYRSFYSYGEATPNKKQFYTEVVPVGPGKGFGIGYNSLVLMEVLGWIKDFSPKNLLIRSEFLYAPGQGGETDISGHVFDGDGKLVKWGTSVNLEWYCPTIK